MTSVALASVSRSLRTSSGTMPYFVGEKSALWSDIRKRSAKRSHGEPARKSGTPRAMTASSAYFSATVTLFFEKRSARNPA